MGEIPVHPLHVQCNSCGKSAHTFNGEDPDGELECDCCTDDHGHTGECRPITITARAFLSGSGGM